MCNEGNEGTIAGSPEPFESGPDGVSLKMMYSVCVGLLII